MNDVSNVREGLGEGLPPCVRRLAVYDGRVCHWHDAHSPTCPDQDFDGKCYSISGAPATTFTDRHQPSIPTCYEDEVEWEYLTDDPAEARAAFERGAEWVRTGEGP